MATEDEIRALCLLVLQSKCSVDFDEALSGLKTALAEHFLEVENLGIHLILQRSKQIAPKLGERESEDDEPKDEPVVA